MYARVNQIHDQFLYIRLTLIRFSSTCIGCVKKRNIDECFPPFLFIHGTVVFGYHAIRINQEFSRAFVCSASEQADVSRRKYRTSARIITINERHEIIGN